MSHFCLLVIGPTNEAELAAALQPFHEFECTGMDDAYVQDIDRTEEAKKEYEASDSSSTESFLEFVEGWYGWKSVTAENIDRSGPHKYGYVLIDDKGEVVKCVDRTNPEKHWDWWVIGGRFAGRLLCGPNARYVMGGTGTALTCDSLRISDIDFDGLKARKKTEAFERFDEWFTLQCFLPVARTLQDIRAEMGTDKEDEARSAYYLQPRVQALRTKFSPMDGDLLSLYPCVPGVDEDRVCRAARTAAGDKAAERPLGAFAVLKDGKWYERGEMGWWGIVHDEKDGDEWDRQFAGLIANLPPETVITYVDCHI